MVEIAGSVTWKDDVCAITTPDLTVRPAGQGVARITVSKDAPLARGKAIWVVSAPGVVIEGVELQGASGGAAVWVEAGFGVTLRNAYLHGNGVGLGAADGGGEITIERCEFARNQRNIAIGRAERFVLTASYSHHSESGGLAESRAAENHILYNRLTGEDGKGTRELDLTGGGRSFVIGNLLHHGSRAGDRVMLAAGDQALFAVNNTFVNEQDGGLFVWTASAFAPAVLRNNIFSGAGTITNHPHASLSHNFSGHPGFRDAGAFDYRLTPSSAAIAAGTGASWGGYELTPAFQYVHPRCLESRSNQSGVDAGALQANELGGPGCDRMAAAFPGVDRAAAKPRAASPQPAVRAAVAAPAMLQLSSGTAGAGESVSLAVTLAGGARLSALQWTLRYPAGSFSSVQITLGPAASAAGKGLACHTASGTVHGVIVGLNATTIGDGIVANALLRTASVATGVTPLEVANPLAVTPGGQLAEISAAGGTVTIQNAPGSGPPASAGLRYVPILPCRVMETRPEYNFEGRAGAFGPPYLQAGETRTLAPAASTVCPVPAIAKALVLNVTVAPRGAVDFVTVWPADEARPAFRTVTAPDGLTVANSAIVRAGLGGAISVFASGPADLVIDVIGYFTDAPQLSNLGYYPLTPCRVLDTRSQYRPSPGPFGPPSLRAGESRRFPLPATPYCPVPPAAAYSVTLTVVPQGPLAFLAAWPAGAGMPNVSTLNSPSGRIVANSVIIPAGEASAIDVFAYGPADLLIDINGYFAPDDGHRGLAYFPVPPCRAVDTASSLSDGVFGGPMFGAQSVRTTPLPAAPGCSGIPSHAGAYALNVTAILGGSPMPFVTVWPAGQAQPIASILNAFEGQAVSNAAIVPAGANAAVNVFALQPTHLILEVAGYFGR